MAAFDRTQREPEPEGCQQSDQPISAPGASSTLLLDDYRRVVEELLFPPIRAALESSIHLAELVETLNLPVSDCFAASRAVAKCRAALRELDEFCARGNRT